MTKSLIERYHDAEKEVSSLAIHIGVQEGAQKSDIMLNDEIAERINKRMPIIAEMRTRKVKLEAFLQDHRWEVAETEATLRDDEVQSKIDRIARLQSQINKLSKEVGDVGSK